MFNTSGGGATQNIVINVKKIVIMSDGEPKVQLSVIRKLLAILGYGPTEKEVKLLIEK